MSQKIDGPLPVSATATANVRSNSVNNKGLPAGSAVTDATPSDSLSLTGEATHLQALQRGLSQAPAVDTSRVQAVRDALQNGSYQINPDSIASSMQALDQQFAG